MSTSLKHEEEPAVVCTLTEPELRERRAGLLHDLRERVEEIRELESGVAFGLPGDDAALALATEVIRLERRCCAFLRFRLDVRPDSAPFWLEITGPEGTREMIRTMFGLEESQA
jgi:hypothetical protein